MNFCSNCTLPSTGSATALFASAINLLVASQCSLTDNFIPDRIKDGDKFDFIIVGAGSAGSVVASRLSEIRKWNILLLEAGFPQPIESYIPQLADDLINTKYDWQFKTVNNGKTSQAFKNGRVPWPRGKMLGGTSSLNGMKYARGNKEDYLSWKNAGNPSWTTERVYANFKKAESFQNQKLKKNPNVKNTYGFNGPQILNRSNSTQQNIYNIVLQSLAQIGLKKVVDANSVEFESPGISSFSTVTGANGKRYSTYQSYLQPVRSRKNLKIVTNAFVTRVLINKNKRAYGVEVDVCNQRLKVFAEQEVILSTGAIKTPQLLMLSGIGSKNHLESKKILCKVNLKAVGENLQDNIQTVIPIYTDKPKALIDIDPKFETIKYLFNYTGLLSENSNSANTNSYYSLNTTAKYPDYQVRFKIIKYSDIKKQFSLYNKSVVQSFLEPPKSKYLFYFSSELLHPLSRGRILLATNNPYDKPLIDASYFSNPRDLQSASNGVRFITKVVNTPFFKSIKAYIQRIKIPECNKFSLNTNRYWQCQIKHTAGSAFHAVATAKMGPNPSDSVVDDNLRVYYVKNLRVIDASVMPTAPSGNINCPTIMVGEMGASMIKSSYGKS